MRRSTNNLDPRAEGSRLTIKLDVRTNFVAEAEAASQIVRELMRDFMARQRAMTPLCRTMLPARIPVRPEGRANEDVDAEFAARRAPRGASLPPLATRDA